jgi:polysaccharide pyruvyl transferase CsaB
MRIVLIGNYGAHNIGDEAVLSGILHLLRKHIPHAEITVLSYDPNNTEQQHHISAAYLLPFGIRSFLKFGWKNTIRVLQQADYVLIGGGALFTDEKMKAMYLWGYHVKIASYYCSRVILFAHTIGPLQTKRGIAIMKKVLGLVQSISVRDVKSKDVIHQLDPTKKVIVASDPAFVLNKIIIQKKKKQVVINLRPWMYNNQMNIIRVMGNVCNNLINKGDNIVLLPFQTFQDDDRKILQQIYDSILNKKSVQFLTNEVDLNAIMQIIGESEFVIGMRLHSLILSILQHVPFIALSYSDKIHNMLVDIHWEQYSIDIQQITEKKIADLVYDIEMHKNEMERKLQKAALDMKQRAAFNLKCFPSDVLEN